MDSIHADTVSFELGLLQVMSVANKDPEILESVISPERTLRADPRPGVRVGFKRRL